MKLTTMRPKAPTKEPMFNKRKSLARGSWNAVGGRGLALN
jgi:hypothetical protein